MTDVPKIRPALADENIVAPFKPCLDLGEISEM